MRGIFILPNGIETLCDSVRGLQKVKKVLQHVKRKYQKENENMVCYLLFVAKEKRLKTVYIKFYFFIDDDDSSEQSSDDEAPDDSDEDVPLKTLKKENDQTDQELNLEIFKVLEERKKYLLSKIRPYSDVNCTSQFIKTYIDYNNAQLIAQYLASKRPFSQSFDKYLVKIILVVK